MVATGAVLGVFGVYLVARKRKGRKPLSKKKLLSILEALGIQMNKVMAQIAQQEKQYRVQAAQQGRRVADAEIYEMVNHLFTDEMAKKEATIYQTHKTTENAVKKAAKKYKGDPDLERITKALAKTAAILKPPTIEIPEDFDVDKLCEFMAEMMEALNTGMEKTVATLKLKGMTPQSQQFQSTIGVALQQHMSVVNERLPKKFGITQAIASAAMKKYEASPKFNRIMQELQEEQKKRLEAIGIEGFA